MLQHNYWLIRTAKKLFVQGPDPDNLAIVARGSEGQGEVEKPAKDQGGDGDIGEGGDGDIITQGGVGDINTQGGDGDN